MEDTGREQSEFNSAISYLNRINAYFFQADECSMQLDIHGWFHSLMIIYRELSTEMKEKELQAFEIKKNNLNQMIMVYYQKRNRFNSNALPPNLYDSLHQFEMDLRKIMKQAGLQTKMKENPFLALR